MTKQTELKNLLQDLERATRAHEMARFTAPGMTVENARTFQAADAAEKRVFSFFDKLRIEIEDSARAYKLLSEQRNYLAKERDDALEKLSRARRERDEANHAVNVAKTQLQVLGRQVMEIQAKAEAVISVTRPDEPFNEARARAGEPIEVRFNGTWHDEVRYVGPGKRHAHVVECLGEWAQSGLSYWDIDAMRMKAKQPQVLQMFATVYKHDGAIWGDLRVKASGDARILSPGREVIVTDAPVNITVTL